MSAPEILVSAIAWTAAAWAVRHSVRSPRRGARKAEAGARRLALGIDGVGRELALSDAQLAAHALILGASGAGKSNTLLALLSEQIVRGEPVVAIDLKGSPEFATVLRRAASGAGRRFVLWTPEGPSHWNPLRFGNPTELKDKLIATERFTEPHYQRAAERYVQTALVVRHEAMPGTPTTLAEVVDLMDPQRLGTLLRALTPERAERIRDYLVSLTPDQLSAIRGLATRLAIVTESHTGPYLAPGPGAEIDLRGALSEGQVVLFSLNSSSYGKLAAQLGTLVVQDLVACAGDRLIQRDRRPASVAIDEFSALGADNVVSLLARGREAGISVLLATQELADLDRAAPGLRDQVLGNTALKLVHRQEVPASAATIAQMTGTRQVWEHSYRIGRGPLGHHDTTAGTRRPREQPVVHPDRIRSLRTGEAVVIANGYGIAPRVVRVRPAGERPALAQRGGEGRGVSGGRSPGAAER